MESEEELACSIRKMFNDIARRYDLLNHLLSLKRDVVWRRKTAVAMNPAGGELVLDLACGTGDMAAAVLKLNTEVAVVGADYSINMLRIAATKLKFAVVAADACLLPFENDLFDKVVIAFGFRNIVDKRKALSEFARVIKKDGVLYILEFSKPKSFVFSKLYWLYFRIVLPAIGKIISGHQSAYKYLPESVKNFPNEQEYAYMVEKAGFEPPMFTPYDFGICTLLTTRKR
jgi:demethylmenaquinone methyltransferase/2-methoxy-6-polyprenyl-1,4-benzoquinol methylase